MHWTQYVIAVWLFFRTWKEIVLSTKTAEGRELAGWIALDLIVPITIAVILSEGGFW